MTARPAARRTRPVIAIDGPGGSGKSTVSREIARRLGWRYLDSGALYRALTVAVIEAGADIFDRAAIAEVAATAEVQVSTDPDDSWTELDGRRVTEQIRSRPVTNAVSAVSAVPEVRAVLLTQQRRIIGDGAIVVEGRDIGTTVVPDAELKVFLTAEPAARATRRHREDSAPDGVELTVTHDEITRRDRLDSTRALSPLSQAEDAMEIDTTTLSIEQVVGVILEHAGDVTGDDRTRSEAEA